MKKTLLFVVLIISMLVSNTSYSQKFITYFNVEEDLNSLRSSEGVQFSRSTDFPILGAYSCKVDFPEKGGVFTLSIKETESFKMIEEVSSVGSEVLLYYIWSNEVGQVVIEVKDSNEKSYSKTINIKKGSNHIQLILAEMTNLDVNNLKSITIKSKNKQTLYVDYIAFDTFQPAIEERGYWGVADFTTEIETPHFSWGNKLEEGTINTFSITPVFDGRGIVELAQRLDIKMDVATIGRNPGAERFGYGDFYKRRVAGHGDSTSYNMAQNYILDKIYFDSDADVIIWPGIHSWDIYPKQIQETVLKMVKEGTGLVLIYPESDQENSTLWDLSPVKNTASVAVQKSMKNKPQSSSDFSEWVKVLDTTHWETTTSHFITKGVAFESFPWGHMGAGVYSKTKGEVLLETKNGNPVLAVSNYGKGRVVSLTYPEKGLIPRVDNNWETGLHYDYWEDMWSLLARSVVWAAKKDSDLQIKNVEKSKKGLLIHLSGVANTSTLEVQVTDGYGNIEETLSLSVKANQSKVKLNFDNPLKGGKHLIKVQLKGEKGVYDWYSLLLDTSKKAQIVNIDTHKEEIPVGEKVEVTISILAEKKSKSVLRFELVDNYGRLVDVQEQQVTLDKKSTFKATLHSDNIISNLSNVEVYLIIKDKQEDHQSKEVFFLQPRVWDEYDVTMYHFMPNPIPGTWTGVDKQLRALNVTSLAAYTIENSKYANYDVQAQTRVHGVQSPHKGPDNAYYFNMRDNYIKTKDKYSLIRKYGLSDPVYLDSMKTELTELVKKWKKFSPSAYYIYEEPSVTFYGAELDLDFSKTSLDSMRVWLKKEYTSLDSLNTEWGTSFKDWKNVVPDDTYEARTRGNYASWADHRTFMEDQWANHYKMTQEIVNEVDPGGLIQLSGTQEAGSHNGNDFTKLVPFVGQMNPYSLSNQLEYHMDFNPKIKLSGASGYGAMGKKVPYLLYRNLFRNLTGGTYVFWQISNMNPDLTLNIAGTDMKNVLNEVLKQGVGRLATKYTPDNELKIAIHYSQPSIHGAWIIDGEIRENDYQTTSKTLTQFNKNRDGWVKALHDMGVGFDFIAYSKVEIGDLVSKGYKVFILPMSYALSDEEVSQIEVFVNNGGILIADALPGVMDDHTKYRTNRALAKVFGIKARKYNEKELTTPSGESKLKLTSAKVLEKRKGKQEILVNHYGKGSAYLLNYFMDYYPEARKTHTSGAALAKLERLFDNENLAPSITITRPNGEAEEGIEMYTFSRACETTQLLGLLVGKEGLDRDVILHLGKPMHLYNIRTKQYLGHSKDFKYRVQNETPEFLGLLENKIDDFKVTAPSELKLGEQVFIQVGFDQEKFSKFASVASVVVEGPKGDKVDCYSKNIDIKNGSGTFTFNTALNDASGNWKIIITEAIGGVEKEVFVTVK